MEIVLDLVDAVLLKELTEYTKVTAIRKQGRVVAAAAAKQTEAAAEKR
jgi:hypothetical protein